MKKLPIGIQDFRELREGGYLYVDKTEQIHRLMDSGKYYFLSRPRRFGKSLLISTLREVFLGNRELFKGLWIENRHDWRAGPVIHMAFNNLGYKDIGLKEAIRLRLEDIAEANGISLTKPGVALAFWELIQKMAKGGKVALLIDEYDKPIIDYLDDLPKALENQQVLDNLFSVIKDADPYLRFILLTGIAKFSQGTLFSGLNNLQDITFSKTYNALAGFTRKEVEQYFNKYINDLIKKHGEPREILLDKIQRWYGGYNWLGQDRVFNPYSILMLMQTGEFQNYWLTANPQVFLPKLRENDRQYELDEINIGSILLEYLDIEQPDYRALLFWSGYLTILNQPVYNVYTLGYPNQEVKDSLLQHLALKTAT